MLVDEKNNGSRGGLAVASEFIQVTSSELNSGSAQSESYEKARLVECDDSFYHADLIKTEIVHSSTILSSSNQKEELYENSGDGGETTKWHFATQCTEWRRNITPTSKIAPNLSAIHCLRFEGFYNYSKRCWNRHYVTKDGVVISLIEDVPESGGQNCLWAAGLVMARYLETKHDAFSLQGKRILELGAGAGLTSMVAALHVGHDGAVYATEQQTCLPYLEKNLALNPGIHVNTRKLHWTNTCGNDIKFDIIFGCDITYDVNNFESIFSSIKKCLVFPSGVLYICHDNDSCPLSKQALKGLKDYALSLNMSLEDVEYRECVGDAFFSDAVKIWRFEYIQ